MLIDFFTSLRKAEVPVTIKELLVLLEALKQRIAFASLDEFYLLSRLCLVKDEKYFDRYFHDLQQLTGITDVIPVEWLNADFIRNLSDEDKEKIKTPGGLEELMETLKKRLEEQEKRHSGGSKWIGTGGNLSVRA